MSRAYLAIMSVLVTGRLEPHLSHIGYLALRSTSTRFHALMPMHLPQKGRLQIWHDAFASKITWFLDMMLDVGPRRPAWYERHDIYDLELSRADQSFWTRWMITYLKRFPRVIVAPYDHKWDRRMYVTAWQYTLAHLTLIVYESTPGTSVITTVLRNAQQAVFGAPRVPYGPPRLLRAAPALITKVLTKRPERPLKYPQRRHCR
jgi:hypothetical protein